MYKGQDKRATTPRQTKVTRSLRSILSVESSGTAGQGPGRSIEPDGTDVVQKTIRVSPLWSCVRLLFDATGPPNGDTPHRGPGKLKGKHCNDKTTRKATYSRLLRLTGSGLYTILSSRPHLLSQRPSPPPASRLCGALPTRVLSLVAREAIQRTSWQG